MFLFRPPVRAGCARASVQNYARAAFELLFALYVVYGVVDLIRDVYHVAMKHEEYLEMHDVRFGSGWFWMDVARHGECT